MGEKKFQPIPEVERLFEGMGELLTDEEGNPLSPDHPQYQTMAGLLQHMAQAMDHQNQKSSPDKQTEDA